MFGSPEPETCGVDQEVSADAAESNTKSKVEEYPILPNPVMPQLGTGGAIASFLQSNEKDKATEWSFWGSTAVPSGFKVVGPKPKIPLPQQDETVSSCAKAVNNLPTASTTLPIPDLNKQSNTASQPAAEVVSQRNAIFLTEDGKITTFPPGAAAASSDTYMKDTSVEMKDGERLADAQRGQESPTELVPQPFVARLRELEDIQYDTQKSERRYDGVEHKARDVDKNTSLDGVVGGQLPVALRCPECLRFHHGRCSRPSQPCILCGGQHWVKQCNCRSLRLAKTYRPGISCTRCRFMHKNKCPTADACPICLRIHKGLCLKPSGTCRYCGKEHWENSCPRWEQLDEEMGFFVEPEEGKALKAADMAGRVARFWDPDAPYFDKLKTKLLEEIDIEPGECITQDDFLKVVSKRDELRRLPPTYANAKAVKRDVMSTLLGKNGSGFAYARPRDGAYRDHSPIHRGNEMKRGYCDFDRDYDRDYHLYDDTESRRGRGFGMYRVRDSRSDYRSKYAHGARETKGKTLDRNETRDDRNQGVYYQNHDDLPTKSNRESAESGPSVLQPSTDPATIRSRRDELWGRDRKGVEMEKIVGIYADLKAREARLEEQIKEREKEEKGKRNNEGRDWAKSKPGGSRDLSEPRRRFGKRGESNKRAPSVSSLRGKTVDDGLEKWGDSDLYSKRRRNE
ncbi:hypothetical protein EV426DRAFT_582522 [Tirmania nivea]|nr:hypothetical protein EV426DRAFT_582522 [Tirmania nivea]